MNASKTETNIRKDLDKSASQIACDLQTHVDGLRDLAWKFHKEIEKQSYGSTRQQMEDLARLGDIARATTELQNAIAHLV